MEDEIELLELENGSSYMILDRININNNDYVYLINKNDKTDLLFQRISYETNPPQLSPIESEEEFNSVLGFFGKKYINLLDNKEE